MKTLIVASALISSITAFSQEIPFVECGTDLDTPASNDRGLLLPASGAIRALWIVCKFSDDNFDSAPFTDRWPSSLNSPQTFPSWTNTMLAGMSSPPFPFESISGWYDEM